MAVIRDKESDRAATRKLILSLNRRAYPGGENWLGHGEEGGKHAEIDYLLLDGATMDQLLKYRNTKASVRSHFESLKNTNGLPVKRYPDRKYRFDRDHLGVVTPTEALTVFEQETAGLPRETEAERLVIMRLGQDIFRKALFVYWHERCPLTSITDTNLLRASHIVPRAECETDSLRLDPNNGLLLSSLWDAAFDAGLVGFSDTGKPVVSKALSKNARQALHLDRSPTLGEVSPARARMLNRHRRKHRLD